MCFGFTNASTESVPRMNIRAMMGAASTTDRPMVRAGCRHSPARMATYSKPLNAPMAILPNTFKLNKETAGMAMTKG